MYVYCIHIYSVYEYVKEDTVLCYWAVAMASVPLASLGWSVLLSHTGLQPRPVLGLAFRDASIRTRIRISILSGTVNMCYILSTVCLISFIMCLTCDMSYFIYDN